MPFCQLGIIATDVTAQAIVHQPELPGYRLQRIWSCSVQADSFGIFFLAYP